MRFHNFRKEDLFFQASKFELSQICREVYIGEKICSIDGALYSKFPTELRILFPSPLEWNRFRRAYEVSSFLAST